MLSESPFTSIAEKMAKKYLFKGQICGQKSKFPLKMEFSPKKKDVTSTILAATAAGSWVMSNKRYLSTFPLAGLGASWCCCRCKATSS